MRIGIDARMLGPQCGGLGRYVEQLVEHLETLDPQNQYVIFLRKENWNAFRVTQPNFKKVLADIPWYGWGEQLKFKKIIAAEAVNLMHFPHWNVPLLYNDPFVVTIHDLLLLHYPTREASTLGPLGYFIKNLAYRLVLWHAARKSKQILAPSAFTKQDIIDKLRVSGEKITVTYEAPLKIPAPDALHAMSESHQRIAEVLIAPYVLYVGVAYPHKNLERLLLAWQLFEKNYDSDVQMVLVGKRNFFYERLLASEAFRGCRRVVYLGFVSDEELSEVYHGASLYVFPSLYEGFGLPPLEAMTNGVPVVSSNRSCLPEILGEAALYFDPENIAQMAEAMYHGLHDEELREQLRQNAKLELRRYSWDKMAHETLAVYARALA